MSFSGITVEDLDNQAELVKIRQDVYKAASTAKSEAHAELEIEKYKLMDMLEETGKTSWKTEGIGSFSVSESVSPKLTSDPMEKEQFFEWLSAKGKDFYVTHVGVNSNTLKSMVKNELEMNPDIEIPGVDITNKRKTLSIRKG